MHALVRDKATQDILWFIFDSPYLAVNNMMKFTLKGLPASELLMPSAYYKTPGVWNLIFTGSDLLSKSYTTQMGYFMRFSFS